MDLRFVGVLWLALATSCIEPDLVTCGEQVCTSGSICLASGRCVSQAQLTSCADKAVDADCVVGTSTGRCVDGACTSASCGNGILEPGELCDDGNRTSGDGCSFDCNSHETCGNGVVDFVVGEECDDGNTDGNDACEASCKLPRCGDSIINPSIPEQCDDGNRVDGDGCSRDCLSDESCGNGVRDPGEECDDGNLTDHDGCQSNCKVQRCGDGVVDMDEVCDDGNFDNRDACLNTCLAASCGDGFVWLGHEQCDDANLDNTDSCPRTCQLARCGDGFYYAGHEECDDGNTNDVDCCHNNCRTPVCGDGIRECAELCDDMNTIDTDTCRNQCTLVCPPGGIDLDWRGLDTEMLSSADPPSGMAGEFGGTTYAWDNTNSRSIYPTIASYNDASSATDLQVSGTSFYDVPTGGIENDLSVCSTNGGSGTLSVSFTLSLVDRCGAVHTVTYGPVGYTDTNWPACF